MGGNGICQLTFFIPQYIIYCSYGGNMSLRIIYGRAGTGKSEYCYREIAEKIKSGNQILIITPEQFSFTAEKMQYLMQK